MNERSRLGQIFGGFRLDAVLGKGGFATVYRAVDSESGEFVAVKVLDDEFRTSDRDRSRFDREFDAVAQLHDPHTVSVVTSGASDDGTPFIVFEYIEGRDLAEVLAETGRLESSRVLQILRQVLASLAEAHAAGIIHRDLKPENIRITSRGDNSWFVKVLDFGVARVISASGGTLTRTGEMIGTPRYMSPEQLLSEEHSPASDIYSLGLVAIELLLGREALQGNRWVDQFDRLESGHYFAPAGVANAQLLAVLQRMTARDPDDRFQTAAEVLGALDTLTAERSADPTRHERPAIQRPDRASEGDPTWRDEQTVDRDLEATLETEPTVERLDGPTTEDPPNVEPTTVEVTKPDASNDADAPVVEPHPTPAASGDYAAKDDTTLERQRAKWSDALTAARPRRDAAGPDSSQQAGARSGRSQVPVVVTAMLIGMLLMGIIWFAFERAGADDQPARNRPARAVLSSPREPAAPIRSARPSEPSPNPAAARPRAAAPPPVEPAERVPGCDAAPDWRGIRSFEKKGRRHVIYVPEGYEPEAEHPLVIMIHHTAETPENMLNDSGAASLAEREKFVILAPATASAQINRWGGAPNRVHVKAALLDTVKRTCIDLRRVFVVGHGDGGGFAQSFACDARLAGLATHGYVPFSTAPMPCEPNPPVPYLIILGRDDPLHPTGRRDCLNKDHLDLSTLRMVWQQRLGCGSVPFDSTVQGGVASVDRPDGQCVRWRCDVPFVNCLVDGDGSWRKRTGNPPWRKACVSSEPTFPVMEKIWEFFAEQSSVVLHR